MEEMNKAIVTGILRAGAQIEERLNESLKAAQLSVPQFNVLRILRGQKQRAVSLSVVQRHMIKKMSNTSRLIDKLMDKGLVSREVCAKNRRQVDICITLQGLELLQQLDSIIATTEEALTKNLSPEEKKHFLQLIRQFSAVPQEKN